MKFLQNIKDHYIIISWKLNTNSSKKKSQSSSLSSIFQYEKDHERYKAAANDKRKSKKIIKIDRRQKVVKYDHIDHSQL